MRTNPTTQHTGQIVFRGPWQGGVIHHVGTSPLIGIMGAKKTHKKTSGAGKR